MCECRYVGISVVSLTFDVSSKFLKLSLSSDRLSENHSSQLQSSHGHFDLPSITPAGSVGFASAGRASWNFAHVPAECLVIIRVNLCSHRV